MRSPLAARIVASGALLAGAFALAPVPSAPDDPRRLGGDLSIDDASAEAFAFAAPTLDAAQRRTFAVGNSFFKQNWVTAPASVAGRDGLGPLFNARSCSACHAHDGRGRPPTGDETSSTGLLLRAGVRGPDGRVTAHPIYGGQIQDQAVLGIVPEAAMSISHALIEGRHGDGESFTLERPTYSLRALADGAFGDDALLGSRVAPALIGLGLLEAVEENVIVALADPDDADGDGISGRAARITSRGLLGRFGWKATQATVADQVASAFANDIGITSVRVPDDGLTAAQQARVAMRSESPEISERSFDAVVFYSRLLAVPMRRDIDEPAVRRGQALFVDMGCAACHAPELVTGPAFVAGAAAELPMLRGQRIHPFTDLLLHDMGPELADGLPEGDASASEWRTPPLWGLGLIERVNGHERLLHDGRARGIAEAILWHGGEAKRSREAFVALPRADREAVVAFLRSL